MSHTKTEGVRLNSQSSSNLDILCKRHLSHLFLIRVALAFIDNLGLGSHAIWLKNVLYGQDCNSESIYLT